MPARASTVDRKLDALIGELRRLRRDLRRVLVIPTETLDDYRNPAHIVRAYTASFRSRGRSRQ